MDKNFKQYKLKDTINMLNKTGIINHANTSIKLILKKKKKKNHNILNDNHHIMKRK